MPVAVVTDSTAYLPREQAEAAGVGVVPVQVVIGGEAHDESAVTSADVAEALRSWTPVTTSRPSPHSFLDEYERLATRGADAIVSVHLSGAMSATVESASLAARDSPVPVTVIDSRLIGMGLGFCVLTGAQAAVAGADAADVAAAVRSRMAGSGVLFYVDTLEYLRRGGRIGAAAALVGSALSVKPLLQLVDGHVEPLEKVRTASKALARLETLTVEHAGDGPVDVAVQHLANPERALALTTRLQERMGGRATVSVSEVGAVVGAHVGPGMIAVAVAPR
jgi:DegV family protein with EDD domain